MQGVHAEALAPEKDAVPHGKQTASAEALHAVAVYVPGPQVEQAVHVDCALRNEPGKQAQTVSAMALHALAM